MQAGTIQSVVRVPICTAVTTAAGRPSIRPAGLGPVGAAGLTRAAHGDVERADEALRAALDTPGVIPTAVLRQWITILERLQDELRARDAAAAPTHVPRRDTLHWFQRGAALLGGQVREVLEQLKTGCSEKEIAHAMRRSPHTVHSHVKTIYRHFGVSSRSELLALWVGAVSEDGRARAPQMAPAAQTWPVAPAGHRMAPPFPA
jgi:hypothetical protein